MEQVDFDKMIALGGPEIVRYQTIPKIWNMIKLSPEYGTGRF